MDSSLMSRIMVKFQVKEVALPARRRNARLSFAFVYPDKNGRFVVKQVRVYVHLYVTDLFLQCNLHMPAN